MSNSTADNSVRTPNTARRVVLGCLCIPAALFVLSLLGGWLWYAGEMSKARRDLAKELQFIRERGAPLTTVDLDGWYRVDPEREDITVELLKLLVIADDATVQPLAIPLPFVGQGAEPPPPGTEWPQLAEAEAYLAHHQRLLDLLATLPNRRVTVRYPADFALGIHTPLPHVQQVRHAARALQLQWHVDLHRGRPEAAANRILETLALADTLRNEPVIVSQLVRSAVNYVAVKMLENTLKQADISDADLIRLQLALRQYDPQQAWGQALQGERASFYTASTLPFSQLNNEAPTRKQMEDFAGRQPARPHDAALTLRLFRQVEVANDESMEKAIAAGQKIDLELKKIAASPMQRVIHLQTMLLMPALTAGAQGMAQNAATLNAADAALAAVRFRRVNQVWPQSLAQLVPEFLPQVPLDPFDGKPLRIVVTANELKVYSIGKDLTDDGGDLTEPQNKDRGFVATWREP